MRPFSPLAGAQITASSRILQRKEDTQEHSNHLSSQRYLNQTVHAFHKDLTGLRKWGGKLQYFILLALHKPESLDSFTKTIEFHHTIQMQLPLTLHSLTLLDQNNKHKLKYTLIRDDWVEQGSSSLWAYHNSGFCFALLDCHDQIERSLHFACWVNRKLIQATIQQMIPH